MTTTTATPTEALRADLLLVGITGFWGVTFVIVQDGLQHADPFTFLALRFLVGAVAATAMAGKRVFDPRTLRAGLLLGVFLFLGFAFQTYGLTYTTPSRSAFITGLAVVLVPIVSIALFRRWPRLPAWLGVGLSVAGLFVMTGGFDPGQNAGVLRGDLLTLGCALTFAFHIVLTERLSRGVSATALVAVQLWVTAALSGACALWQGPRVVWNPGLVSAVLICGVLASAVAISVQTWAQARTTAVRAALIFSMEPVFAAFFSVILGRELLDFPMLVGGALILVGVLVAEASTVLFDRWRRSRLGLTSS